MNGKVPVSVITYGDLAMRSAIKMVFHNAHHRLYAWHLIRNATTNVKNPRSLSLFEQCILGEYEIYEFEAKWDQMVQVCGLQDNVWVGQLYEKKKMWATTYIKGNFFVGFRITSRVEGLHLLLGKFVNSRNNLSEFLEHHHRCLCHMRFKKVEDDFESIHGEQELQTQLTTLEKSALGVYTKEVFLLFPMVLQSASRVNVTREIRTAFGFIYFVSRYRRPDKEWHVSFWLSTMDLKCSCQRMESIGIPCDHLVSVMVYLDMVDIPDNLVLNRWSMSAKDYLHSGELRGVDSMMVCCYQALRIASKLLCKVGMKTTKDFSELMTIINTESEKHERQQSAENYSLGPMG
ncbi:Zinc finger, SWIM-type [Sesbania bispinosa]|nr:Zinc finger, SWIM-type [Sesbania bispinosa]